MMKNFITLLIWGLLHKNIFVSVQEKQMEFVGAEISSYPQNYL